MLSSPILTVYNIGCPEPTPDHAPNCVEMGLSMIKVRGFKGEREKGRVRGWVKKGRVGMKMKGDRGVEENA